MNKNLRLIKGVANCKICKDWQPWLEQTAELFERLRARGEKPFYGHEQASVGVLLGGAVLAGYLAMIEYEVDKGSPASGRADLWIEIGQTDYWFEFKRSAHDIYSNKRWSLENSLASAEGDFKDLYFAKQELGFASVIAATTSLNGKKREIYEKFVELVDIAYHIGPENSSGAYLYFKLVREG